MNKKHIFMFIVILALILGCAFVGFHYHDSIERFLNGENWRYIESYAQINDIQPRYYFGRNLLGICTKDGFNIYSKNELTKREEFTTKSIVYDSEGSYTAMHTVDAKTLYLIKDGDIVYKKTMENVPKVIYTNGDGYIVVLYSQTGYKTGIKVYNPTGEEILTTYLASSYATCVDISKDNKMIYLGEVYSTGIKVKSKIKMINLSNKESKDFELPLGSIVSDISANHNKILAKTDIGMYSVDTSTSEVEELINYNSEEVLSAFLDNNGIVLIKNNNGISEEEQTSEYVMTYINNNNAINVPMDSVPQGVDAYEGIIALNFGNEVWIVKNGHLKNKILIDEALNGMEIFSNGKELALIYRNKIEVVKI